MLFSKKKSILAGGTSLSLQLKHWFKPLYSLIDAGSLYMYDFKDIALDKAHTVGRRATWRDYFDLFYILKNKFYSVEEILKNARKKFGVEFSAEQFLSQLTYYDDLTEFNLVFTDKSYTQDEIKNFLTQEVESYAKKIISK
ncbi:nucleotidyl transferase AbiEii/AbiGii toxin family protein [Candidatus Roizmanbacteria bacterium]|nr:nucleotidyl transferase AbiEii/AbiGii toxin family protein [Candidatus Roizmanbacteria bacterium]